MHKSRYQGHQQKGGRRDARTERAWDTGQQGSWSLQLYSSFMSPFSIMMDRENYITWRAGNKDANIFFPHIKMDALEA